MNELVQMDNLPVGKYSQDEQFNAIAVSSNYLPYIQLYGGNSDACKTGKIPIGTYGVVRSKDNIENLTPMVDVLVLAWRPRAMNTSGEEIVTVYNPESPVFKKIAEDSETQNSGCMYGPEFLLWLPTAKPTCFATFFMSSKTSRRESPNMRALKGKAATLKAHLIETKKFKWHGPVVVPCSSFSYEIPDEVEIVDIMKKFGNPPETELEKAPETVGRER